MAVGANPEEVLRGLALGEGAVADQILKLHADNLTESALDKKSYALVRIAALVAIGAEEASFVSNVKVAVDWGVTADDITGVLIALAPMVGAPRIVAAAPKIATALGVVAES
jgi:alkylhydroperoxidase/carboxymuconolactone decarboxylase family protein YurZ